MNQNNTRSRVHRRNRRSFGVSSLVGPALFAGVIAGALMLSSAYPEPALSIIQPEPEVVFPVARANPFKPGKFAESDSYTDEQRVIASATVVARQVGGGS